MGDDDYAAGIADKLERQQSLEIAEKEKRRVPDFCVSFAELAVLLNRSSGRHEVKNSIGVVFSNSSDAKRPRGHVREFEDCECSASKRTRDEMIGESIPEEKLEKAGEGSDATSIRTLAPQ